MTTCPYCGKKFYTLSPAHLKTHGKTRSDVMKEYPEIRNFGAPVVLPSANTEADFYCIGRNRRIKDYHATGKHDHWTNTGGVLKTSRG